jgi:hypothetical protein
MKALSRDENGLIICEECKKTYNTFKGLVLHIHHSHNAKYKDYYDTWIKDDGEGLCKICNNEALFKNMDYGYKGGCCKDHIMKSNQIQIKNAVNKKYSVQNIFQTESCKNKIKQTLLKHYGVEHTHQNKDILKKSLKSGFKISQYKNTDIWYQGNYEFDFLEKFYDKCDIQSGPSIKYNFEGKQHTYHTDYFMPSLNLVIEIKSTYFYNIHKDKNVFKKNATIYNGYKYILILDKQYENFKALTHF